jgi:DedD protein
MNKGWSSFMDRRVKERLVGASILVVLVVLFVPELLSGPKRAVVPPSPPGATLPMRRVTIDLTTSKATVGSDPAESTAGAASSGEPASAVSLDDPASGAAAPGAGSGGSAASPAPAPTSAPSAANPASGAQPAPPPAADEVESGAASPTVPVATSKAQPVRRGWVAQLGSFAARDNAEKLERQLRSQGFSPVLSSVGAGPSLRFRVRIGPVADRGAAQTLVAKLGKAGHPATLVAP